MKRFIGLSIALSFVVPSVAEARKHSGVILDFSGYKAKQARSAVLFKVAPFMEVVPRSELAETAEDLDASIDTDEGLSAAASNLGLSLVIRGKVFRQGARAKTTITVADAEGRVLASGRAASPKTRRGRIRIGQVAAKLVRRALRKVGAPPARDEAFDDEAGVNDEDDEVLEADVATTRTVVRPSETDMEAANRELGLDPAIDDDDEPAFEPDPGPVRERRPSIEIEDDEDEPVVEDKDDRPAGRTTTSITPKTKKRRPLLTAVSGFTIRTRSARIGQTNGQNAQHKSGAFPEFTVGLRITPFKPKSTLDGAYVQLDGNYGLGVSSLERTDEVATAAYRFQAGIGYTVEVSDFDVGGTLGIGHDAVTLGENGIMGAARYTYVRLGGVARWAVSSSFDLHAEVALRPIFDAGELGSRYGQGAGAFGFDMSAGFLGRTDVGFVYGLTAGLNLYALLFSAPGDLSPPVTATGGLDSSILVSTLVGWQF